MSGLNPWDFGVDKHSTPERVCIIASGRATIVPMIGAPDVLLYRGVIYYRSPLYLSGFDTTRFFYTELAPTLVEKRAAEGAFRNDEEEQ
jgi:hypothetical protein